MDFASSPSSRPDRAAPARGRRAVSTGPPRLTPLREQQLVQAYHDGESEALGELLQAYQHRIYGVCYRMLGSADDAADMAQEALVKIIEGLPGYQSQSKLSTWIIRVTMNCCLSELRRRKVRKHGSLDTPVAGADAGEPARPLVAKLASQREPGVAQRIEQSEQAAVVSAALASLDPQVRALLVLRDVQGLEYEDISTVLEVPLGTVKSRLFRARAALREAVERMNGSEEDVDRREGDSGSHFGGESGG